MRQLVCRLVLLAPMLVGCGATRSRPAQGDDRATALTYSIPVLVESRYRAELTLFVVHDGTVSRLQNLTPSANHRITIPPRFVGTTGAVSLLVEGVGARSGQAEHRYQSQRVRVLPGQSLKFTIETDLPRSFLQVQSDPSTTPPEPASRRVVGPGSR
jgi:hypothetical protein